MSLLTIDAERCRKDGLCVRICQKVFVQKDRESVPEVAHEEFCYLCGHCVIVCPAGAISHADYPPASFRPVEKELLPSYEQVREMIRARRSTRTFLDRPVERGLIEKVIDAARFAPSAKNTQSTRFTVIEDRSLLHSIASMTAGWLGGAARKLRNPFLRKLYVMRGNARNEEEAERWAAQFELIAERMRQGKDMILFDAPVLILFHAAKRIRFANENANLSLQNATFASFSLGLGSFYTGYVVTACRMDRAILQLLKLPDKDEVFAGLALGYPHIKFSQWVERNPAQVTWL
jgi:nitroreductase/NAD-dependent dihydropyrimidine dehydrogenase PreA subunit